MKDSTHSCFTHLVIAYFRVSSEKKTLKKPCQLSKMRVKLEKGINAEDEGVLSVMIRFYSTKLLNAQLNLY